MAAEKLSFVSRLERLIIAGAISGDAPSKIRTRIMPLLSVVDTDENHNNTSTSLSVSLYRILTESPSLRLFPPPQEYMTRLTNMIIDLLSQLGFECDDSLAELPYLFPTAILPLPPINPLTRLFVNPSSAASAADAIAHDRRWRGYAIRIPTALLGPNRSPAVLATPTTGPDVDVLTVPLAVAATHTFGGAEGTSAAVWAAGGVAAVVLAANAAAAAPWICGHGGSDTLPDYFELGCGTGIAGCGLAVGDAVRAAAAAAGARTVGSGRAAAAEASAQAPGMRRVHFNDASAVALRHAALGYARCAAVGPVVVGVARAADAAGAATGPLVGASHQLAPADVTHTSAQWELGLADAAVVRDPVDDDGEVRHAAREGASTLGELPADVTLWPFYWPPAAVTLLQATKPDGEHDADLAAALRWVSAAATGAGDGRAPSVVVAADTIYDPEPLVASVALLGASVRAGGSHVFMFAQRRGDALWSLLQTSLRQNNIEAAVLCIMPSAAVGGSDGEFDVTGWTWQTVPRVGTMLTPALSRVPRQPDLTANDAGSCGRALTFDDVESGDVALLHLHGI